MVRWKINPWSLLLLASVVTVVLLLVVLPDVDPPDTAFHRDTSPVAVHAQATTAPAAFSIAAAVQSLHAPEASPQFRTQLPFDAYSTPNFRPIFLRTIRC